MTKLENIEKDIAGLSREELKALAVWFEALQAERWDDMFAEDVQAGRLDDLANAALGDFRAGRTRPL